MIAFNKSRRTKESRATSPRTCPTCGKSFMARPDVQYCSKRCGKALSKAEIDRRANDKASALVASLRPFSWCGTHFASTNRNNVYCSGACSVEVSKECQAIQRRMAIRSRQMANVRQCDECGSEFHGHMGKRFCGNRCLIRHERRNERHSRRARMRGSDYLTLCWRSIWSRDHGTCYLCGHKCLTRYIKGDPLSPTIDHVIPLSRGGTHTPDNVRLACHQCNSIKSDTVYSPP